MITRDEAQTGGGVEHRDVDPFHLHSDHLSLGVVLALDREVEPAGVGEPRAGERLRAVGAAGAAPFPVLLQLGVLRRREAVDHDRAAPRLAVGPDRRRHAVLEPWIQIPLEQIHRLHDVHVAIHKPQSILHATLPV